MVDRLAPSTRHKFMHEGRTVYEWDQTFSDVNIYVDVPKGVRGKDLYCSFQSSHLSIGIKPNPPYLDRDLAGPVKASDSFWTLEDNVLNITLSKLQPGEPWRSALQGHELDPLTQQADQQRLLLERFQQEHPGFDFSGAKFNGAAPNPRTFMSDTDMGSRADDTG